MKCCGSRAAVFLFCSGFLLSSGLLVCPGCSASIPLVEPGAGRQPDGKRFSRLSDEKYLEYLFACVHRVVEGHQDGTALLHFARERCRQAQAWGGEIQLREFGRRGDHFWIAFPPEHEMTYPFQYRDDIDVLLLARRPLTPFFAGAYFAQTLRHAQFNLTMAPPGKVDLTCFLYEELDAYQLEIELVDHVTHSRFSTAIRNAFEEGRIVRGVDRLYRMDQALVDELDVLLGVPYPEEEPLRNALYMIAVNLAACETTRERQEVMALMLAASGQNINPAAEGWEPYFRLCPGVVLGYRAGEHIRSPVQGRVTALRGAIVEGGFWHEIVIEGREGYRGTTFRLIGIVPAVAIGESIIAGQIIGDSVPCSSPVFTTPGIPASSAPLCQAFIELYTQQRRIDPRTFLVASLDRIQGIAPGEVEYPASDRDEVISRILELEANREYRQAIEELQGIFRLPGPGDMHAFLYHLLARLQAARGDFPAAVEAQRSLLRLLEYELAYANGEFPNPALGMIITIRLPQALNLLIQRHEENLQAYLAGEDTRFIY